MKQGKIIAEDGTERWFKDGKRHREEGPAVITKEGDEYWFIDGLLHREDGLAIIKKDGSGVYYLNHKLIDKDDYLKVQNCPLEELPLYINTELAPIVRRRLKII